MMKSNGFKKDKLRYLLPPAITLVIYSVILAVKGIYPFGSNTIDYYDMAQQIAAFYYHVYDALHGTKGFFYDWYTALGVNMAMSTSGCSNISPFNLFFLFIRRSSLLKSLSVFNGIKLVCMSFTMYLYLNKTHEKSPAFFKIAASVGYSFCGFVLVLYITNQWIDIAVMFPLIMYFYDKMLKTGRMAGYVITLTITLIASYYLGFMILIFIFLYTGVILAEDRLFPTGRSMTGWKKPLFGRKRSSETEAAESAGEDVSGVDREEVSGDIPTVDYSEISAEISVDVPAEDPVDISTEIPAEDSKEVIAEVSEEVAAEISSERKKWDERTVPVYRLGIGTVLSLALSSFIVIPQLTQMLSSARFKNGNGSESTGLIGKYLEILSHVRGDYTTRWWSLLGISFMTAVILTGLFDCIRKRIINRDAGKAEESAAVSESDSTGITMTDILSRKPVFTTVVLILMMVLELFVESINLIWHFGSYIQYPIRNGFIIYFIFAYLSCYFAGEIYQGESEGTDEKASPYLGFIFTVIAFLIFIAIYRNHPGKALRSVFHMTTAIMAVSFVFYMIVLNFETLKKSLHLKKEKMLEEEIKVSEERQSKKRYRWASGVLAFELLCYGFLLFGKPDFITGYTEEPEQNGEYINLSEQLHEGFGLGSEFLYRLKNPDESLNANYGLVLMQPALSNWTHLIAPGEQDGAAAWGYSVQFTRLLDSGGTVFSDALLGIRKIISCVPMDERLYEPVEGENTVTVKTLSGEDVEYTMYQPKYTLPFGVVLKENEDTEDKIRQALEDKDTVGLHNAIYEAVAYSLEENKNSEDLLAESNGKRIASWIVKDGAVMEEETNVDASESKTRRELTIETRVGDETALYLLGSGGDKEYANCTIEILSGDSGKDKGVAVDTESGRFVRVPTIGDSDNIYYPAHFNNNAVYLGCYKDETIKLRIIMDTEKGEEFEPDLMGISMDALERLCRLYHGEADNEMAAGGRSLTFGTEIETSVGDSSIMLLPMTYDKGWKVERNGHRVRAYSLAGLFTAVPLVTGENNVVMKFTPSGTIVGTIITIAALLMVIACIIICRIKKEDMIASLGEKVTPVLNTVYLCVTAAVVLGMYIVPIVYGIYTLAAGR